jgi:L-ascorbate metabolism protein UlaG (beta-lactamase superfamily)
MSAIDQFLVHICTLLNMKCGTYGLIKLIVFLATQIIEMMKTIIIIAISIVVIVLLIVLYVSLHPVFGGKPKGEELQRILDSENFKDDEFINIESTQVMLEGGSIFGTMWEWIKGPENGTPDSVSTMVFDTEEFLITDDSTFNITWFGHSSVMLNMGGKVILFDPVFNGYASPIPNLNKSFKFTNPIDIEKLPEIDILLISHDHYDHLDKPTIEKLDSKVSAYFVPLGVKAHLVKWGVDPAKVSIADWWDEFDIDSSLKIVATPARHFSGRSTKRNTTLWCSWVVKGPKGSIYFGADSGYGNHFKTIGDKYGPFDLTMVECGQYNERWPSIHAMPEQSVDAHIDLKGEKMLAIHWSKFQLALHSWTDPIERARVAAGINGVNLIEPIIGDVEKISVSNYHQSRATFSHQ